MNETTSIVGADIRDRVVISSESQRARQIGFLALTGAFGGMILLVGHAHDASDWYAAGRLTLSLSLSLAVVLVARGILLGRPVTVGHAGVAAVLAATGLTHPPVVVSVARRRAHRVRRPRVDLASAVAPGSRCAGARVGADRGNP